MSEPKTLKQSYDELKEKYELLLDDRLNQKTIKALMDRSLKLKAALAKQHKYAHDNLKADNEWQIKYITEQALSDLESKVKK